MDLIFKIELQVSLAGIALKQFDTLPLRQHFLTGGLREGIGGKKSVMAEKVKFVVFY